MSDSASGAWPADLSPVMRQRTRAEANRRDLDQIEYTEADVEALSFNDALADRALAELCVSYTGLYCVSAGGGGLVEIARGLRPSRYRCRR